MLSCPNPSCKKPLPALTRVCSFCQTDLSLLVDYVGDLRSALDRAAELTRAGELGPAVTAYLEVLEVDPDNPTARQQVGQVAAAVRHFDQSRLGRGSSRGLPGEEGSWPGWWVAVGAFWLLLVVFLIGYQIGSHGF
jgi:hypothetical protein